MQDKLSADILKKKYLQTLEYFDQQRMQRFIGIVLTLIALSFFGLFAINPTVSTILKLRKEIEDSKFIDTRLETKIGNLSKLRGEYANLEKDLTFINDAIPSKPDVHLLLAQIQAASSLTNVKISKLQNFEVEVIKNNKAPGKNYFSYSFSIAGTGAQDNIHKFVHSITQMQRIVSLDVLSINSISTSDIQEVGFTIQGTAFFMEQEI